MLNQILSLLAKGSVLSQMQLARHLGTTQGLVEQMLEDLERRGYVARFGGDCELAKCRACASKGSCAYTIALSGWSLTAKGREAAQRSP